MPKIKFFLITLFAFFFAAFLVYLSNIYNIQIYFDVLTITVSILLLVVIYSQRTIMDKQNEIIERQANIMEDQKNLSNEQFKISKLTYEQNEPNLEVFSTTTPQQRLDISGDGEDIVLITNLIIYNTSLRNNMVISVIPESKFKIPSASHIFRLYPIIGQERFFIKADNFEEKTFSLPMFHDLSLQKHITIENVEKFSKEIELIIRDIHRKEYKIVLKNLEISGKLRGRVFNIEKSIEKK